MFSQCISLYHPPLPSSGPSSGHIILIVTLLPFPLPHTIHPPTLNQTPYGSVSCAHPAVHGSLVLACQKPHKQNQVICFSELQEMQSLDLFFLPHIWCVYTQIWPGGFVCWAVGSEAEISAEPLQSCHSPLPQSGQQAQQRPAQEQAMRGWGVGGYQSYMHTLIYQRSLILCI